MRLVLFAAAAASVMSGPANAADKPVVGPTPSWVKPVSAPAPGSTTSKDDAAPIRILLSDQQLSLEQGRQTVYSETAIKLQSPQGLAAGNISFAWRPDTQVLTVHKLLVRRGAQVIDVLASGQTFTVVRRETNLESATLDGVLTANIQPEGLQVGDVIEFAASITSSDPVMKGHVEQIVGAWNGIAFGRAHLRVQWPSTLSPMWRQGPGLPPLRSTTTAGLTSVELSAEDLQPLVAPKGAPLRYQLGRLVEVTDFRSWADLAALMSPLYDAAAVLPASGPLRTELDRIRSASADPKMRAQAALSLVQDRVRYVALAMGAGGLVPAGAELTWSRRYGDCKAKTALLVAFLRALDIQAEPVAVNTVLGDGLNARLPMIGLFDHVLVRATIGGRAYWLDGTRSGDANLDRLKTPAFGWGLPLTPKGAALVRIVPPPLSEPTETVTIHIDAHAGLTVPAPTKVDTVLTGDGAVAASLGLASLSGEARDRALRDYWRARYDFIDPQTVTATFDAKTGEQRLSMTGLARMAWDSGWYETDGTAVGYKADFRRDPGPDADAPYAVPFPYYTRNVETILLPPGFSAANSGLKADVDETVAGIAYRRRATLTDGVFRIEKTERSMAPEFPAKDAPGAQAALRKLAEQFVYLRKPDDYKPTGAEVAVMLAATPTTADGFVERGDLLLDRHRYDEAISDFTRANALDPKDAWALANRGLAHVWEDEDAAATKDLDAAFAIDARNAVVFRARGLMAQRKAQHRDAVAAYTTALEIEPGNAFALGHRAEANKAAGATEAALSDAAAALKKDPIWFDMYLLRANILRNAGKMQAALAEATAMSAAGPTSSFAQVATANLFRALGREANAMRAYERALAIKPEAYIYLNRALGRPKRDVAGRRADIQAALALEPALDEARMADAALRMENGDFPGAIAIYSAVIAHAPDRAEPLNSRGIAYARAGDAARADRDFAAARAKATEPGTLNGMCWDKATAGVALASALADCDAALRKTPDIAAYLDSRALVLLRLGRLDEAIAAYDRALASAPAMSSALFGRAVAWARKGNKDKADADAAAALRANADVEAEFAGYGVKR